MAKYDFVTPDGYKPVREIRIELLDPYSWNGPILSQEDVDQIMDMFWFRDSYSGFIAKENVYPKFLEFLKEKNGKPFRRMDFYNYLFSNHSLKNELLKLSYFFEDNMTDRISQEAYKQLEGNSSFHTQELIEEGWLITDKDELVITHHTISEYFVAKDISESKTPIKDFANKSIIKVNQTKENFFNPPWYGVAHFLLESEIAPQVTDFFTNLADENKKVVDQNYSEILSHSNLDLLSKEQKETLFSQIYSNAKESGIWISEWAVAGLANLYTVESTQPLENDLIDKPDEFPDIVKTANVVAAMGELIEEKKVSSEGTVQNWKKLFIKYATQKNGNGVLQRRSLKALENFSDPSIIDEVKEVFDFKSGGISDQLVQEAFLRLCYIIAPNHKTTLEYIIQGFFSQGRPYAWYALQKITDNDILLEFLKELSSDEHLLDKFLEDESIFLKSDQDEKEKPVIQNIRKLAKSPKSNEFLEVAIDLIIEACDVQRYYFLEKKTFIPTILEIALDAKPDFWDDLLSKKPGKKRNKDHFNLVHLLGSITTDDNFEQIIQSVKKYVPDFVERYVYSIPSVEI